MLVYHGTSAEGTKLIEKFGLLKNESPMNIDSKGSSTFINAVFVTPDMDIAHIYEQNTKATNKKGTSRILEIELNSNKLFDLAIEENQNIIKDFLKDSNNTIEKFLIENNYDGVKQIHINDFGRKRTEIAIINIEVLQVVKIPKKGTSFMSLYGIATAPDSY